MRIRGRVRWDEANLSEIEANKPVRKKIDEPKTPYHPLIEEDGSPTPARDTVATTMDYAAHAEELQNALSKVALTRRHENGSFGGWISSSEEEGETMEKDHQGFRKQRDALSFTNRRTAHYDEFRKVKELQQKACVLNDEHGSGSPLTLGIETREIYIEGRDDEIMQIIEIEENGDVGCPH